MKTVMLITFDHPNAWEYLVALRKRHIIPAAIVAEYNPRSVEKVRRIIRERTGKQYRMPQFSDIKHLLDTPVYFTGAINSKGTIDILKRLKADIVVFSADAIVGREILRAPSIGVINCHPALLPRYRGCNAIEWPIYEDSPLGSTCHIMDEGIDTGPIVYKEKMPIYRRDTYEGIRMRSMLFTARVMAKGVELLLNGIKPAPQLPGEGIYHTRMEEKQLNAVRRIVRQKRYGHYHDKRT